MKSLRNILLLLPLLLYLILILLNSSVFFAGFDINVFGIVQAHIPVMIWVSFFFIAYGLLLWFSLSLSTFFSEHRNKKLADQVSEMKGQLADRHKDMMQKAIEDMQKRSTQQLEIYKKEITAVKGEIQLEFDHIKKILSQHKDTK